MKLITKEIMKQLRSNRKGADNIPALKLFTPWGSATWLISEVVDEDTLFGLCDLGMGCPELGCVSITELESVRGPFGLKVERDLHFSPNGKKLSEYTSEAMRRGGIVA